MLCIIAVTRDCLGCMGEMTGSHVSLHVRHAHRGQGAQRGRRLLSLLPQEPCTHTHMPYDKCPHSWGHRNALGWHSMTPKGRESLLSRLLKCRCKATEVYVLHITGIAWVYSASSDMKVSCRPFACPCFQP